MTDKVLAAYRAWMKAANPVGSYRGHTVHSTAGVHKLFGPAGPTLFTGVGAMGKLRSHVDALPAKRNPKTSRFIVGDKRDYPKISLSIDGKYSVTTWFPTIKSAVAHFQAKYPGARVRGSKEKRNPQKNPQRRVWRVSFSHVDGPVGEKRLRAIVSRWSGQLRVSGGDHIATFAAQDDANAAVRQAGSAGFGGQVREGIIQRKNTGQTTTRPKRNHHLAVGTPVLSAGHIARITKQLPKDYYTIKYVDTGSLRTVRGSTLNKK